MDLFSDENLHNAKKISIIGIDFFTFDIERFLIEKISEHLSKNNQLKVDIIYPSETSNFYKKHYEEDDLAISQYSDTKTLREALETGEGFINKVLTEVANIYKYKLKKELDETEQSLIKKNFFIRCNNFPHQFNAIVINEKIWYRPQIGGLASSLSEYRLLSMDDIEYGLVSTYIDKLLNDGKLSKFLSKPSDEVIEIYEAVKDRKEQDRTAYYRRGTMARSGFYTTAYMRYSVWEFIFNRRGQLLLHQRSSLAKDNRLLWDKSAGGHLNLTDASTEETAKKEFIEELLSSKAEYDEYHDMRIRSITNFGEWKLSRRPVETFRQAFDGLPASDIVMFRATENNMPLTISDSPTSRLMSENKSKLQGLSEKERRAASGERDEKGNWTEEPNPEYFERIKRGKHILFVEKIDVEKTWPAPTWFISDVFFFVAPKGLIDTEDQMYDSLYNVYKEGAAHDHKLISVLELKKWIEKERAEHKEYGVFTEDLINMVDKHGELLQTFSSFIKNIFESK